MFNLNQKLEKLAQSQSAELLTKGLRGIEKEGLRATPQGLLSQRPHPRDLGSKLTHPFITTDYSEALLELITPAFTQIDSVLEHLSNLHRTVYASLQQQEYIWAASMPTILPKEQDIPIADYGQSNEGLFKTIYRRGLAYRYGKAMQCIAGIHYNFSLDPAFWQYWAKNQSYDAADLQPFISDQYFHIIRNFKRYSWLLIYLFGASPALDRTFAKDRTLDLQSFDDKTLFAPYATSLRMSDFGYTNKSAQSTIKIKYQHLDEYIEGLAKAVSQVYPSYQLIGTHRDDQWIQINNNILQIENEFYSSIRPKRVLGLESRSLDALKKQGVQYIEVRCMDIDPFLPLGIDAQTCRFLDAFLIFCLLEESPYLTDLCLKEVNQNMSLVTKQGRLSDLTLQNHGKSRKLQEWALQLLDQIFAVATFLDQATDKNDFIESVKQQYLKVTDASLTPSAKVLEQMQTQQYSFVDFGIAQSQNHAQHFLSKPLTESEKEQAHELAMRSIAEQEAIERQQTESLDEFMQRWQ